MDILQTGERQVLIDLLIDQHGRKLTRQRFTELTLDLFEDIPGLEGLSVVDAAHLCHQLWRTYCEQEEHQDRNQ